MIHGGYRHSPNGERYNDYDQELEDFWERVDMLYNDSLIREGVGNPDLGEEIWVVRRLDEDVLQKVENFVVDHGDSSFQCEALRQALQEAIPSKRTTYKVIVPEAGLDWLRHRMEDVKDYFSKWYEKELGKFLRTESKRSVYA